MMSNFWKIVGAIVFLWIAIGSGAFIYRECGMRGFLYGEGALYAAASGTCKQGTE